ncbi:MAG: MXAN_5187 C-terminal domain-containing protein [Acidobacteriota bacterium]
MAEIGQNFDRDMSRIQQLLQQLKLQYNLFFAGARKDPPEAEHQELDRMVRFYRNRALTNFAQQFRFSSLANSYVTYAEQWNKYLRIREDGLADDPRMVAAVQQGRREFRDLEKGRVETREHEEKSAEGSLKQNAAGKRNPPGSGKKPPPERKLFEEYLNAKLLNGQVPSMDFKQFKNHLARQEESIKQKYEGENVSFRVVNRNGKVTLKARVVKKSG